MKNALIVISLVFLILGGLAEKHCRVVFCTAAIMIQICAAVIEICEEIEKIKKP